MSIFSIGKRLIDKHPRLLKVASLLYCFLSFNFFTGRKSNTIKRTGAFLQGCRITIKGKDNKVILGNCCYCKKLTINIMGNNNTIIVEDNVALNDVNICVEDSGGLVMIEVVLEYLVQHMWLKLREQK